VFLPGRGVALVIARGRLKPRSHACGPLHVRSPAPSPNFGTRASGNQLASRMPGSLSTTSAHTACVLMSISIQRQRGPRLFLSIRSAPGKHSPPFAVRSASKPSGATAKFTRGHESGESLSWSLKFPRVNNPLRVSLVIRLMHAWPLTQCCSGLSARPACVSAERQVEVARAEAQQQQREKGQLLHSSRVAGTPDALSVAPAPAPRRRPTGQSGQHTQGQSLPRQLPGLLLLWAVRP